MVAIKLSKSESLNSWEVRYPRRLNIEDVHSNQESTPTRTDFNVIIVSIFKQHKKPLCILTILKVM